MELGIVDRYYKVKFQYENELEVRDIITVRKEQRGIEE